MPEDAEKPADTVEWGDAATERPSWLAPDPSPVEPADATDPATPPRERLNAVAIGLAAAGFALVLAAQYLPWLHYDRDQANPSGNDVDLPTVLTFELGTIQNSQVLTYQLSLMLILAAVAVTLTVGAHLRRVAAAVTFGLLAANVAVLVGLGRGLSRGAIGQFSSAPVDDDNISLGAGYTVAFVAAAAFAAATFLAVRGPFARRTRITRPVEEDDQAPIDLTVTALPEDGPR